MSCMCVTTDLLQITQLGYEIDWNATFKHFYFFLDEFHLVEARELAPLKDVIALFNASRHLAPTSAAGLPPERSSPRTSTTQINEQERDQLRVSMVKASFDKLGKVIATWTPDQVGEWIEKLEDGALAQYKEAFVKNAISGADLLELNEDELQNGLQIEALGHRKQLMRAIRALNS